MRWVLPLIASGCSSLFIDETLPASADPDHDGFADADDDNCPGLVNVDQADRDNDGIGDACARWCDGQCADPMFCDCLDFDGDPVFPPAWSLNSVDGGRTMTFVEDVRSPPTALYFSVPGLLETTIGHNKSVLTRGFPTDRKVVHFEYDWKLLPYGFRDRDTNLQFGSVFIGLAGRVSITNNFNDAAATPYDNWTFSVALPPMSFSIPAPPGDGSRWVRVTMDVKFADTPTGYIVLAYDGVEVLRRENLTTARSFVQFPATTIGADLGVFTLQGQTGRETPNVNLIHDNVLVRVE
ncbi:MAG: hypothetical protein H0T42_24420 [Deltaproteobacteria bacterium]|nr:hypothetical protein [Deltaproteobacteria bacterium]